MDYQHVFAFVKAIYRADFDAVGVFAGDTVVVDDIGHAKARVARVKGLAKSAASIIQGGARVKDHLAAGHVSSDDLFPRILGFAEQRLGVAAWGATCLNKAPAPLVQVRAGFRWPPLRQCVPRDLGQR
jgi:hypothetical protein